MTGSAPAPPVDDERVGPRLRSNLMAWLTTVDASGRPWTTPVWFLHRNDGTVLLYTRPRAAKLRHIAANPSVSLVLDVTDLGRSVVRIRGTARVDHEQAAAPDNEDFRVKYAERLAAMFGDVESFAEEFSVPVVVEPTYVGG